MARPAHCKRLPSQFGAFPHLDRRIKCVHVEMDDGAPLRCAVVRRQSTGHRLPSTYSHTASTIGARTFPPQTHWMGRGSLALAGRRRRLRARQALPAHSGSRRWCHRPTSSRVFFARCFAGSLNASSKEVSSPTNETSFSKCGANRSRSSIAPAIAQTGLPSCRAI